ncbi:hypothetical protein GCM10025734_38310 [Kitasatospora paranensis]
MLARLVGHQQVAAAAVVGEADALDDGVDAVAVALRVGEPADGQHAGALAGEDARRPRVEGLAEAVLRVGVQVGEAEVDEGRVGGAHPAGEHQVGLAGGEVVAGELQRVQRRGAGGVQRVPGTAEAEGGADDPRGRAADVGVRRVPDGPGPPRRHRHAAAAQPVHDGLLDERQAEVGRTGRREGVVAQHQPGPGEQLGPVEVPGAAQRLPGHVQRPVEDPVEPGEALRGEPVAGRVEGEVADESAAGAGDAVLRVEVARVRGRSEDLRSALGAAVRGGAEVVPELLRGLGAREQAGKADDGVRAHGSCGPSGLRGGPAGRTVTAGRTCRVGCVSR